MELIKGKAIRLFDAEGKHILSIVPCVENEDNWDLAVANTGEVLYCDLKYDLFFTSIVETNPTIVDSEPVPEETLGEILK